VLDVLRRAVVRRLLALERRPVVLDRRVDALALRDEVLRPLVAAVPPVLLLLVVAI